MFSKAFSNPGKSIWIIQGAGIIWLFGCFGLLKQQEVDTLTALVDSAIFAILFLVGVNMLDRVFGFYVPRGSNNWLLLILPLIYSLAAVFLHLLIVRRLFIGDVDYMASLKDQFFIRWAFLGLAEVLVTLIAIVVSKLEQQEDSQKRESLMNELSREAELTQLRQQLQPHFLFNSLNSISALVVSQPKKAREMVIHLSDFLRGTIKKDHKQWVTLQEELGYLKMYLDIEQVRFGHRLTVVFEVEDAADKSLIPQLLIQPLLENAIKHGLYGTTEEVEIKLCAGMSQNYLTIKVENPFDPKVAAPKGTGFGLSSIERRLFLIFGRKDLLKSNASADRFFVHLKIPQTK